GAQGFGMARSNSEDPLHLGKLAYSHLSKGLSLQNLLATEGLFISKDGTRLMINGQLTIDPKEVGSVQLLDGQLAAFRKSWNQNPTSPQLDYFGSFAIVSANATQIKQDIILTVTLALLFIVG